MGMLQGLQDPSLMAAKKNAEQELLSKVKADPSLKVHAAAWDRIAEVQQRNAKRQGTMVNLNTRVFNIAQTLVQLAAENKKPDGERLTEYRDAARESLEQQLFSEAPIYKELEAAVLGDLIARMVEERGGNDELCIKILAGKSPAARATELVNGTEVVDVEFRKQLALGSSQTVETSDDPMIELARLVDDEVRKYRKESEELEEIERQAYAEIAEALFATKGTTSYPDATFTLRLAFGRVLGYEDQGNSLSAWTTMGGAFQHEADHEGQQDFQLPKSWHQNRERINPDTPLNFVSTADIIGGNSGSPVINKELELVGLIFDGNIHSLTGDYMYRQGQDRATSVHSSAIRDALRYVYDAEHLADELGN
jgi:hypothetical protein